MSTLEYTSSMFAPHSVSCLDTCSPPQVININMAFNSIESISIVDTCGNEYGIDSLKIAYSIDNVCWSCYMSYDEFFTNTLNMKTDFYARIKVNGSVGGVSINGISYSDYSVVLDSGFQFTYCSTEVSSNLYSPYTNMDCAIGLQQQLVENVACMFGIPIYYFKLSPDTGSADLTFKEYALMNVEAVKQIKMIVMDNQMPSSKPTFNEWGLDWESDWETEISKGMFATAFGPTAQPMEGDLIYVPMMKRMWMVNGAYEEKKDAFMWNATTFKLALVKYQQKDSVDLGDTEDFVNKLVKNKYEDLFGDQENLDSNEKNLESPTYRPDNLYSVATSDAFRKYITTDSIDFKNGIIYYKGTMIADDKYIMSSMKKSKIVYQNKFCGDSATVSFIIKPYPCVYSEVFMMLSGITFNIDQTKVSTSITLVNNKKCKVVLQNNKTYFVIFRWAKHMNIVEAFAAEYVHADMPEYKLQNHHYWFDIDNAMTSSARYDIEMIQDTEGSIELNTFSGEITNIKVFDIYVGNTSEILQMLPNNQHLLLNDTARKLISNNGGLVR